MKVTARQLAQMARDAGETSYSPYSRFRVGAALQTKTKVYLGTNVENRSYSLTVCAERAAVFMAVAAGERDFLQLAVASPTGDFIPPCGACLQVLAEFCEDLKILLVSADGKIKKTSLRRLYPFPFRPKK